GVSVANQKAGAGAVLVLGAGTVFALTPTNQPYSDSLGLDQTEIAPSPTQNWGHRAAVFGSQFFLPNLDGSGFSIYDPIGLSVTTASTLPARWFQTSNGRLWRGHSRNVVTSIGQGQDPTVS